MWVTRLLPTDIVVLTHRGACGRSLVIENVHRRSTYVEVWATAVYPDGNVDHYRLEMIKSVFREGGAWLSGAGIQVGFIANEMGIKMLVDTADVKLDITKLGSWREAADTLPASLCEDVIPAGNEMAECTMHDGVYRVALP
jgi:hypothetical protein